MLRSARTIRPRRTCTRTRPPTRGRLRTTSSAGSTQNSSRGRGAMSRQRRSPPERAPRLPVSIEATALLTLSPPRRACLIDLHADDASIAQIAEDPERVELRHAGDVEDLFDRHPPVHARQQEPRAVVEREPADLVARHRDL